MTKVPLSPKLNHSKDFRSQLFQRFSRHLLVAAQNNFDDLELELGVKLG